MERGKLGLPAFERNTRLSRIEKSSSASGINPTYRGGPTRVGNDPGRVKTRRRSIAIEQVTRSRPFHVPTSQAHSILESKSRISFSSGFKLLSFHSAWT